MDATALVVGRIIKEQQAIIGPVAIDQAKKVAGLNVVNIDEIKITGNTKQVLGDLVNQYAKLFGRTSIEVCREAFSNVSDKIPTEQVPDILKN